MHSRFFSLRGILGALAFGPAIFFTALSTPTLIAGAAPARICEVLAWGFLTLYVTIRIWATLHIGGRKDRVLQTEGIYSATRNPLYLGSACLALSATLFLRSPAMLVATSVVFVLYALWIVPGEERVLRRRFGEEFERYMQSTPRFIPSFARYRRPESVEVEWSALVREAKRLWTAAAIPLVASLAEWMRTSATWPHWFNTL